MKKLVFSALAVVAFSGVVLANTAGVNGKVVTMSENKVEILVVQGPGDNEGTATPCEDKALDFYEVIIADGEDNLTLLNELISACH